VSAKMISASRNRHRLDSALGECLVMVTNVPSTSERTSLMRDGSGRAAPLTELRVSARWRRLASSVVVVSLEGAITLDQFVSGGVVMEFGFVGGFEFGDDLTASTLRVLRPLINESTPRSRLGEHHVLVERDE